MKKLTWDWKKDEWLQNRIAFDNVPQLKEYREFVKRRIEEFTEIKSTSKDYTEVFDGKMLEICKRSLQVLNVAIRKKEERTLFNFEGLNGRQKRRGNGINK